MTETPTRWQDKINTSRTATTWAGYGLIVALVASFGYWAATAPIARAAIAQGNIAAAGRNVLIQHLEGGVVEDILAREGDHVVAGQKLYVLDPTSARATVNRLNKRIVSLEASIWRLEAERDGLAALPAPGPGNQSTDVDTFRELFEEQSKEFDVRLSRFQSEQEILRQRVATLEKSASGLQAQKASIDRQVEIIQEDLARKKKLVDKGLTNLFEYTQIQRNESNLIGQAGSLSSQLDANATQILEAREQLERIKTQRVEEAVTRLNEMRDQLADGEEQYRAAQAVLTRTTIAAPVAGIVISMIYNSVGSVISPGEKIAEILPTTDRPIVEARLSPQEIDAVHIGQSARLRLTALNARTTPEVAGKVTHVSADRIVDSATNEIYYRARLQITDQLPEGVNADQLYPGMPVEAFIDGGERTFFQYLLQPILDSFNRAFSEE